MTDDAPDRAELMRRLPDDVRLDAIEASPNVVGFERFEQKRKQVDLRDAYRGPK